ASGWAKIGYIMIFLHDHEAAAAALEEALRLKPDYADARLRYALALELRGDAERAISEYRSAIAMPAPIAKDPFWAERFAQILYRPLGELPGIVEEARRLGAKSVWIQSGLNPTGARDPKGCWMSDEDVRSARAIVETTGLELLTEPYIGDAARQFAASR
ncbi:MAG TPA: tetratricopeptide repeat protein, partial [Armatimonadota bacterium]|nr:tetratricopeptide repeat protein [Armatimonadota bacterium]